MLQTTTVCCIFIFAESCINPKLRCFQREYWGKVLNSLQKQQFQSPFHSLLCKQSKNYFPSVNRDAFGNSINHLRWGNTAKSVEVPKRTYLCQSPVFNQILKTKLSWLLSVCQIRFFTLKSVSILFPAELKPWVEWHQLLCFSGKPWSS